MYTFFFNDTATTEIYTLSLHDALPISQKKRSYERRQSHSQHLFLIGLMLLDLWNLLHIFRSEEHTSELQSHHDLVCRLLLEKKNSQ